LSKLQTEEGTFKALSELLDRNRLKEICQTGSISSISELEQSVDQALKELAWAEGYLMARGADGGGDSGHTVANQEGKRTLKKVRSALGYTAP
jgi:hypothetical protein